MPCMVIWLEAVATRHHQMYLINALHSSRTYWLLFKAVINCAAVAFQFLPRLIIESVVFFQVRSQETDAHRDCERGGKMVSEIYLTRLLTTKVCLPFHFITSLTLFIHHVGALRNTARSECEHCNWLALNWIEFAPACPNGCHNTWDLEASQGRVIIIFCCEQYLACSAQYCFTM